MKKKNILYNVLNFILIIFAILCMQKMYEAISIVHYNIFDMYEGLFLLTIFTIFTTLLLINLVLGILNIKRKNNAIGVLNIVTSGITLINIVLTIIYYVSYDDVWSYIIFFELTCQLIISIINLILNRKKESEDLKKHSIIIFCIIVVVCTVLYVLPRMLLKINQDRLVKAYNILKQENKQQLFIDYRSNFYDTTGKLIAENDYEIVSTKKMYDTYIITAKDKNNNLCVVDYSGEKVVQLYDIFSSSSTFFLDDLIMTLRQNNSSQYDATNSENGIKYISAKIVQDNYLKFTDENGQISIEVEIDKTQLENDTSISELLEQYNTKYNNPYSDTYYRTNAVVEEIYRYKKNYYMTYKNNERVKLECNNLLIDYREENGNYIIYMYNNWNIPFYDKEESGYYDLEGKKIAVNKQYIIFNTFEQYMVVYNKLSNNYDVLTYNSNNRASVEELKYCTEDYVYGDRKLYLINNGRIENVLDGITYTINIGDDILYASSVYDHYNAIRY